MVRIWYRDNWFQNLKFSLCVTLNIPPAYTVWHSRLKWCTRHRNPSLYASFIHTASAYISWYKTPHWCLQTTASTYTMMIHYASLMHAALLIPRWHKWIHWCGIQYRYLPCWHGVLHLRIQHQHKQCGNNMLDWCIIYSTLMHQISFL